MLEMEDDREQPWNLHACKSCPYRSKSTFVMCKHVRLHKIRPKTDTFVCDTKTPEKLECEYCDFETDLKVNLCEHFRVSHEENEVNVAIEEILRCFRCTNCDFETYSLLVFVKHTNDCEIQEEIKNRPPSQHSLSIDEEKRFSTDDDFDYQPSYASSDQATNTEPTVPRKLPKNRWRKLNFEDSNTTTASHTSTNSIEINRTKGKQHYCTYCGKMFVEISRHLMSQHACEKEMTEVLKMPVNSKERNDGLKKIRIAGDAKYNRKASLDNRIVIRRGSISQVKNAVECTNCKSLLSTRNFARHERRCTGRPANKRRVLAEARRPNLERRLDKPKTFEERCVEKLMQPIKSNRNFKTQASLVLAKHSDDCNKVQDKNISRSSSTIAALQNKSVSIERPSHTQINVSEKVLTSGQCLENLEMAKKQLETLTSWKVFLGTFNPSSYKCFLSVDNEERSSTVDADYQSNPTSSDDEATSLESTVPKTLLNKSRREYQATTVQSSISQTSLFTDNSLRVSHTSTTSIEEKRLKGKQHFCIYCRKMFVRLSYHLVKQHASEKEIAEVIKMPINSKERNDVLKKIRITGDAEYNRKAPLHNRIVLRRSSTLQVKNAVECTNCKSLLSARNFTRHERRCTGRPPNNRRILAEARRANLERRLEKPKIFKEKCIEKLIEPIKSDIVRHEIESDFCLRLATERYAMMHGTADTAQQSNRQHLRRLARLLLEIKEIDPTVTDYEHCISFSGYDVLLEAVFRMCKLNAETKIFEKPALAQILISEITFLSESLRNHYVQKGLSKDAIEWINLSNFISMHEKITRSTLAELLRGTDKKI